MAARIHISIREDFGRRIVLGSVVLLLPLVGFAADGPVSPSHVALSSKTLASGPGTAVFDELFYQSANGRIALPFQLDGISKRAEKEIITSDGRLVKISIKPDDENFMVSLSTHPSRGILKWGLAVQANDSEYFTGLMERVVDGPQQASCLKPTTSFAIFAAAIRNEFESSGKGRRSN